MTPILLSFLLLAALGFFAYTLYRRFRLLRGARADKRFDNVAERIRQVLVYAFGQKKFLRDEQPAGWMHFFIFWGFVIVGARTITIFAQGYSPDFYLPGLHPTGLGGPYVLMKDLIELAVVAAVLVALYRWLVSHPPRLFGFRPAENRLAGHSHWEALVILLFIFTLMVSDLVYDGARFALGGDAALAAESRWAIVSASVGRALMLGLTPDAVQLTGTAAWWVHVLVILTFLNLLPRSKHFHIITAIPNVFFRKLEPAGRLSYMDLENSEHYGTSRIDQFTWKQFLDMFSCTECGRCSSACPATASGKPLAPRQLLLDLRDYLYTHEQEVAKQSNGGKGGETESKVIVGDVIKDETLWSCTTCRACEEACPVLIEYVDKIVDMRRHLVQEESRFPAELGKTLKAMETQGNPWSLGQATRDAWAEGLDIPRLADHPDAEYVYYVGCAGSFDERSKKTTAALAKILKRAGVNFAILGKEELCNGETARRIGNEYLFQTMAQGLIEVFNGYTVKKVLTNCPHCFNTLKNEYPQLGGNYEVVHAAEFVLGLVREGKLVLDGEFSKKLTYHDACYYGRYNQIYDAPRELLGKAGAKVGEMKKCRHNAMCCGAGGGWMWMDEPKDKRVNYIRVEQALETDPEVIAVSCPYCMVMIEDGLKAKGMEEKVQTLDVMELVEKSARK